MLDDSIAKVESADKDNASNVMKFLLTHPIGSKLVEVAGEVANERNGEGIVGDLVSAAQSQLLELQKIEAFDCFLQSSGDWKQYNMVFEKISASREKSKEQLASRQASD